ncbi:MAG: non-canonical purine NTP diphosphatase [Flavobacteriaceae bacterium]
MKLVFATQNRNKLNEVRLLLPSKFQLLSLADIGCTEEILETADTLEENALIKADYIYSKFGYPCFADDTGLLVEALNGAPGVRSARYAGEHKNAADNMEKLLMKLRPHPNRRARFVTVIALKISEESKLFIGQVEGLITSEKRGAGGFGYDPIFQPDGYLNTFAEQPIRLKNEISHRGRALRQLTDYLSDLD